MDTQDVWNPPSLWSAQPHFRTTRKGKVLKNVSERYLRDDLGLGFLLGRPSTSLTGASAARLKSNNINIDSTQQLLSMLVHPQYDRKMSSENETQIIICDANVLLHNLDILEHASGAISNIVVPQTSLAECKKNSLSAYNRVIHLLREADSSKRCVIFFPNEYHVETQPDISSNGATKKLSENDKNDSKIRKVAEFFGTQLKGTSVKVILLTDDYQSRMLAKKENQNANTYDAQSVRFHVKGLEKNDPSLNISDLVAQFSAPSSSETNTENNSSSGKLVHVSSLFRPHLSSSDLLLGVKSGKYYQGYIRAKRVSSGNSYFQCYVTVRRGDERIAVSITNSQNINRAVDGDVVVIQLHSVDTWLNESDSAKEMKHQEKDYNKEHPSLKTGIAQETAEPSIRDEENIKDSLSIPKSHIDKQNEKDSEEIVRCQPTGKVVGIVRRNFRQNYCGSIYNSQNKSSDESSGKQVNKDSSIEDLDLQTRSSIVEKCEADHTDGTSTCVFFAVDARIPPILVRTTQKERLLGKRILVAIDSWPSDSPYPLGHYVKTIGEAGIKDVETEVLLHEHDIPCDPFPAKVRMLVIQLHCV